MPPVVNVHTHFQPESVLALVAPYGIEMTAGPDGKSWYLLQLPGLGQRADLGDGSPKLKPPSPAYCEEHP